VRRGRKSGARRLDRPDRFSRIEVMMSRLSWVTFSAVAVSVGCFATSAAAQQWHERHDPHYYGPPPHMWHGDIERFHERDITVWHGGRWIHDRHDGRFGWWWVVGGVWYFYPAPVYPYPDPYTPPMVEMAPTGGTVYWYCPSPAGYYPYVAVCPSPWQRMTSVVAPPPAPAPPPVVGQRTLDDRQLDAFGSEFTGIDRHNHRVAVKRMHDLAVRVETFRKDLMSRNYNAMDILRDTEALRDRIGAEIARLRRG
jgi:hypothetical protein